MSLFPSANVDIGKERKVKSENKDWLENKSFGSEAAAVLHQQQVDDYRKRLLESPPFHGDDQDEPLFKKIKEEHVPENDVDETGSSSDNNSATETKEEVNDLTCKISLDKSSDKNNLYFKKPYKVHIPRFRRSVQTCMGLPPHFQIVFEKDHRKKKHSAKDRYFHINTELLDLHQEEDIAGSLKEKIEKLNVETRENQNNVEVWLELVALQDHLPGKKFKLKVEKKIAILDKAIAANPREYQLKLKRLEFLESISEDSDREWKNLVFLHPESKAAWEAYINYTLKHSRFTVSRTLKVFEKCLETLTAIRKQTHRADGFVKSVEEEMMEIFEKLVEFLIQSGNSERTMVLILLMLEINLRGDTCMDVADAKLFYESGEPILGEADSRGWDEWHKKHLRGGWASDVSMATTQGEEEEDVDFDKSINENWLEMESNRGMRNLLPWRSDEDCEDPGRRVSYDDVKGFLFLVKEVKLKLRLLDILVRVVGTRLENESTNPTFLLTQPCQLTHAYHSNEPLGSVKKLGDVICGGICSNGVLPREPHHRFLCLVMEQLATSCPGAVRKHVCSSCLSYFVARLSSLQGGQELKAERKRTYKEARKFAKTLLKNDPVNFLLWAKLAKIEFLAENFEECKKISFNALCMCKTQDDAYFLSRVYASLAYEKDIDSVRRVLSALGDGLSFTALLQNDKEVSGTALLRATRSLERTCEELGCLYQQVEECIACELSAFANAVYCHVICLSLTSPALVSSVIEKHIKIMRREKNNGNLQALRDLRHIHDLKIRLINHDYLHCSDYRKALLNALNDIPHCPQFAIKLCQVEVGSSLTSIARRLFSSATDLIRTFFAVYFELLRLRKSVPADQNAVAPRILHVLERSVSSRSSDVLLWRIYASVSKDPRSVLLRATASCPWSKTLACDRIRVGSEKIDDIVAFMQDKGLRVRTPVEEVRLLLAE